MSAKTSSVLQTSIRLTGKHTEGATDRHQGVPGFDQEAYSKASVLCIGAGGLIGHIVPTLVRKGIGSITIVDGDEVEASNLNRQFFFPEDIGKNKAIALASNLYRECTCATSIIGIGKNFEAVEDSLDMRFSAVVCGVDNNPTRLRVSRGFAELGLPVVFTGVSEDADFGYVFIQNRQGACFQCTFPDAESGKFPCPNTPAMKEILQAIGSIAAFAVSMTVVGEFQGWNWRTFRLSSASFDGCASIPRRDGCRCNILEFRKS